MLGLPRKWSENPSGVPVEMSVRGTGEGEIGVFSSLPQSAPIMAQIDDADEGCMCSEGWHQQTQHLANFEYLVALFSF